MLIPELASGEAMSGVITKFAVTSMVMWMAPVAIMYGFYYQVFPGSAAVPVLITAWCVPSICSHEVQKFLVGSDMSITLFQV